MRVTPGVEFPIVVQLPGRESTPVLTYRDLSGNVAGTFTPTTDGLYLAAVTIPDEGNYEFIIRVFEADGTTPSTVYGDFTYEVEVASADAPAATTEAIVAGVIAGLIAPKHRYTTEDGAASVAQGDGTVHA
jgi:hypothetical protein